MTTALQTLTNKLAERFEMGSSENLYQTLIATAFKGQTVSPEQMTALTEQAFTLTALQNTSGYPPRQNAVFLYPKFRICPKTMAGRESLIQYPKGK